MLNNKIDYLASKYYFIRIMPCYPLMKFRAVYRTQSICAKYINSDSQLAYIFKHDQINNQLVSDINFLLFSIHQGI